MRRKAVTTILSMVLGFILIFTGGYYRTTDGVRSESGKLDVKIDGAQEETVKGKPVTINLAKQGMYKKTFNPWTTRINGSVTNEGEEPLQLKFVFVDDDSLPITLAMRQLAWNQEEKTLVRLVLKDEKISFNIYLRVPRELRRQGAIYDGGLEISDAKTGRQLAYVPIKLTNSKQVKQVSSLPRTRVAGEGK
jgi:hypothetical protein